MRKETLSFIFYLAIIFFVMFECGKQFKEYENCIKQLEQSLIEQVQEREVYKNRSEELENIIEESGLVIDNCECY